MTPRPSAYPTSRPSHYWKVLPGGDGWYWDECWEGGFIALSGPSLGGLEERGLADFRRCRSGLLADNPGCSPGHLNQIWRFAKRIRPGDYIAARRGDTGLMAVGRVAGPYHYAAGERQAHRLPVRWTELKLHAPEPARPARVLVELSHRAFADLVRTPLSGREPMPIGGAPMPIGGGGEAGGAHGLEVAEPAPVFPRGAPTALGDAGALPRHPDLAGDPPDPESFGLERGTWDTWLRALRRKGQVILHGPPGTGKTFLAKKLARSLVGPGPGFRELIQLHPSFAYEDFIQGLRPAAGEDGRPAYRMVPGLFLDLCRWAEACGGPCALILDEINRADLARTFGEALHLLEYRDRKILLPGGGRFGIPANLFLIGTMNTADRSIGVLDMALRRRFAFLPVPPDYRVLERRLEAAGFPARGLLETLHRLNEAIGDPHRHLGISYFLGEGLAGELEDIWRTEIEPCLEESCFDRPELVSAFRWERVRGSVLPG